VSVSAARFAVLSSIPFLQCKRSQPPEPVALIYKLSTTLSPTVSRSLQYFSLRFRERSLKSIRSFPRESGILKPWEVFAIRRSGVDSPSRCTLMKKPTPPRTPNQLPPMAQDHLSNIRNHGSTDTTRSGDDPNALAGSLSSSPS